MHGKSSRQATMMSQILCIFMRGWSAPQNPLFTPSVASNLSDLYWIVLIQKGKHFVLAKLPVVTDGFGWVACLILEKTLILHNQNFNLILNFLMLLYLSCICIIHIYLFAHWGNLYFLWFLVQECISMLTIEIH